MHDQSKYSAKYLLPAALALVLAAGLACPSTAQQAFPPRPFAAAPAPYLLGADDVLSIQVINFPELCVPAVTVPSDGRITVPVLGSVAVAGRTTEQVAKTLQAKYAEYYNGAFVSVTLTQRRHQSIQIYGAVSHAQAVEYQPGLRLMEALAMAGGAAENGDLSQVAVTHHQDGRVQTANVSPAAVSGGAAQDILLAPDDTVFVPERHQQISVLGEVAKPGSYAYKDKMTVLDALKDADNVNLPTADLADATLRHDGTTSPLNLDALLRRGETASNVTLAPGDSIYIPVLHNRIYVDGAVRSPGYYAFKPGDRLVDAINGSGGTIAGASDLMKVAVVHQNRVANTVTAQTVDYGKFLQHGDAAVNLPLQPGDAIYVPVKGTSINPLQALAAVIGISATAHGL